MTSLRSLSPSLIRITTAAAVGAALHIGQGNKRIIDQKAVDFSRAVLNQTEIDGEIIVCEGPKDKAPAFNRREKVGGGTGPEVEFVIDPVDGTTAASKGRKDAISALACAPKGCLQVLPDDGYYFKVASKIEVKGKISLDMSIEEMVYKVARIIDKPIENFTVIMLDRERHLDILKKLRKIGVRIILIPDGDIAAAVTTCLPETGIDLLLGAGAGPEATIAGTAIKCLGGTMLVKVWRDQTDAPKRIKRLKMEGVDPDQVYTEEDLAKGNELVFASSGITKGELLDGVKFFEGGAAVHSLCTRLPSGTQEWSLSKLFFKKHPIYEPLI